MKSKTSFFNKVVFKKNFLMYWPLMVCYLVYEIVKVPGSLWIGVKQRLSTEDISCLAASLNLEPDFAAAAFMAVVCGMLFFSYLFKSESVNMMHSLPVTRMELYITNVCSGMVFMFIPQIFVFLITILVSLANGITAVQFIGIWLLSVMGASVFLYALVCFCVMFTGQLFALPVYYVVVNFLSLAVAVGVNGVFHFLGYGINSEMWDYGIWHFCSPLNYMCSNVHVQDVYTRNERGEYIALSLKYSGGKVILWYLALAAVFYLLAWYGYKKRRLESAGDILTFSWIKPVFRWGVGSCTGYAAAVFFAVFLDNVRIRIPERLFFALVLVFASIGFFMADMFVQKSFHVFTGKRFREYCMFFVFSVTAFVCLQVTARMIEQSIPEKNQIKEAYIEMNYPVRFEGDDIEKVLELQKNILSKKKAFKQGNDQDGCISFVYRLKNGKQISRRYEIPYKSRDAAAISRQILAFEEQEDTFMQYLAGSDYREISDIAEVSMESSLGSNLFTLKGEQANRIYEAVLLDVKAGVVQKYNLYNYFWDSHDGWREKYPYASLSMEFRHPNENWNTVYEQMYGRNSDEFAESRKSGYLYLHFGKDCTNILHALVEEGAVADADALEFRKD